VADQWRIEADDEWLSTRRSTAMSRLHRLLPGFGGFADAVSKAELGPLGGAPRKPKLKNEDKEYSVVRPVEQLVSHTTVHLVDPQQCRRCGRPVETLGLTQVDQFGERTTAGAVRQCRHCGADSWMLRSRMPAIERARRTARKTVL
jgi:ribosomal protein L37E